MDKVVIQDYLSYDNIGWKHELKEANIFIVKFSSKP